MKLVVRSREDAATRRTLFIDSETKWPERSCHRTLASSGEGVARGLSTTTTTTASRVRSLVEDAVRVARETGPRATIRRTVEGQRAVVETAFEVARELPAAPLAAATVVRVAQEVVASGSLRPLGGLLEEVPAETGPRFARRLFERLGATYVKIGQFIASSPTLFPEAYVREFERCLDQTPAVPFEAIKKVVEADLGKPLSRVFDRFDPAPLASASIAQVHAAVFEGREVAVKVLKPGVDDLLKADLGFVELAGKTLETIAPELGRLSLADILRDLRETMLEELDFRKERRNLEVYAAWLEAAGLDGVATCPTPYSRASGERTLTMDRLRGVPLTDLDAIRKVVDNPETALVNALNTWAASVLTCDFFHADVHAGNLLVLDDGRVAFLDFGIVGRVPGRIWGAVAAAGDAVVRADYRALATALRDAGASDARVDVEKFAADLEAVFEALSAVQPTVLLETTPEGLNSAQIALDDAEVADVLVNLVSTADRNGVKLPREFGLLVKQALYFDRYTKLLAPDIDLLQDDRLPYLRDATDRSAKKAEAVAEEEEESSRT
ncbi:hypothetical protein CTAYLR_002411 [Chrysophaeum taylorii]|uniref:ABC1 atypical kinase-like domain-containing protein n=1 Tax=Chrysophaeum taylorii TaxID=2483200 RepID=A0AAD7UH50_9STRA|nr:hypothetical protein CTAYLR_002411 [Chrysophaeum taylorii]